jgi:hypothetical protein
VCWRCTGQNLPKKSRALLKLEISLAEMHVSGFAPAEGAGEVKGPLGRSQLLKPVAGTGERKTLRLATSRHV